MYNTVASHTMLSGTFTYLGEAKRLSRIVVHWNSFFGGYKRDISRVDSSVLIKQDPSILSHGTVGCKSKGGCKQGGNRQSFVKRRKPKTMS